MTFILSSDIVLQEELSLNRVRQIVVCSSPQQSLKEFKFLHS